MERRSATRVPPGSTRNGINASSRRASGMRGRFVASSRSGSMTTSSATPSREHRDEGQPDAAGADHGDLHPGQERLTAGTTKPHIGSVDLGRRLVIEAAYSV